MTLANLFKVGNWNRSTCLVNVKVSSEFMRPLSFVSKKKFGCVMPVPMLNCIARNIKSVCCIRRVCSPAASRRRTQRNESRNTLPNFFVWRRYNLLHSCTRVLRAYTLYIYSDHSFLAVRSNFKRRISLTNSTAAPYTTNNHEFMSQNANPIPKPVTYISNHLENIYHDCLPAIFTIIIMNDSRYDRCRCTALSNNRKKQKKPTNENKWTLNSKHCAYLLIAAVF